MMLNEMQVDVKIKRIELCDILLAVSAVSHDSKAPKWELLYAKLYNILEVFDKENFDCE